MSELNPHQTYPGLFWLQPSYPTVYRAVPRWTCFYVKWADSPLASPVSEFVLVAKPKLPDQLSFFIRPFEKRTYYAMAMSVCPSVRPSFPDFFSTCLEISIWNLVYAFSRWHDMSSLSFITIGSLWPSLQAKVGQTQFLQSWPYKSR